MSNALTFTITAIDQASAVFNNVSGNVNNSATAGDKWGKAFTAATAVAGVAAVKFGQDSIQAYTESQQSAQQLEDAFARFPALADSNIAAFQDLNSELAKKTRFDDDALASGQAVLAQFGLTGKQIEELTPLLADYAAKTGGDIESAAQAFGKATMGQGKALKAIGIDFQDAGSASANLEQLMGGLRTQVAGFAEKDGKSAEGQAAILNNQFGEIQETVGEKLVPVMLTLSGVLLETVDFIGRNSDVIIPLVAGLGGLAAVVYTIITVTRVWTAVQTAFNVVMGLNPVVAITLAVVALVAIIVVAWQHSETFQAIVTGAFNGTLDVVKGTYGWVKDNWPLLLAILTGPIGLAVLAITKNWDEIKGGFDAAKNGIGSGIETMVGWFTGMPGRIGGAISGMWTGMRDGFIGAINAIIRAWNGLSFTIGGGTYDPLGTYGPSVTVPAFTFNTPDITPIKLAKGGLAIGRTFAEIGDNRSSRELVLPEEKWSQYGITKANDRPATVVYLNIEVNGYSGDRSALVRDLTRAIAEVRTDGLLDRATVQAAFGGAG